MADTTTCEAAVEVKGTNLAAAPMWFVCGQPSGHSGLHMKDITDVTPERTRVLQVLWAEFPTSHG